VSADSSLASHSSVTSVRGCRIVELPRFGDERGALSFVEPPKHIPFAIRRVYYLYDVPAGQQRGAHAHRALEQLLIAVAGSFTIALDDGVTHVEIALTGPHRGLYLPPLVWHELRDFSPGTVCLSLASEPFDEADYFRDYAAFLDAARQAPR
jgi:dTDP-4-dehydrorhamnose 3,5-epimerase-like enzyme